MTDFKGFVVTASRLSVILEVILWPSPLILVTQKNETVFSINVASADGKMSPVILSLENYFSGLWTNTKIVKYLYDRYGVSLVRRL